MAQRMSLEMMQSRRVIMQELLSPPSTNRVHLQIARRALHDILAEELTPRQREMLTMRYFEQKRVYEIAAELKVNPSTVSRTLHRAEDKIRKSMRFYFDYQNANLEEDF